MILKSIEAIKTVNAVKHQGSVPSIFVEFSEFVYIAQSHKFNSYICILACL